MAYTVHASRGEEVMTTFRLGVANAIAKGRSLAKEGWQVFITDADGNRYRPAQFEQLLLWTAAAG